MSVYQGGHEYGQLVEGGEGGGPQQSVLGQELEGSQ